MQREEVALLLSLSIWGIGKLSPLELPDIGTRWTCPGVSKSQIGEGRCQERCCSQGGGLQCESPGRLVPREGFQNEARLESYWLGSGAVKAGAALGSRAPCPKGDPQKQTSSEGAAAALCVWRRGFRGIPSHSSYSVSKNKKTKKNPKLYSLLTIKHAHSCRKFN